MTAEQRTPSFKPDLPPAHINNQFRAFSFVAGK
jgi:hypothetical protein